ncbi:MAG: TetR/AcrR family transcriptional regulator [Anaerolineae bacterium]|nr:TetR/AcrR family transcriptional regulator [Anaerolineae bacterium]
MRKERDGDSTRELVINIAKEVFAEHGFAGTSLAMISEKSGISNGLILYHFKNKENLYKIVLDTLAREYFEAITGTVNPTGQPGEVMQSMLRSTFKYWSEDNVYNKISTWAYLENRGELINEEVKLTLNLASKIEALQTHGLVDGRFSPFVLMCMTIGPIQFWIRHRELFKEALQLELSLEALNELFLDQYILLIKKLYQSG